MFDRAHHRIVARVLEALDPELLLGSCCLFGGGTAIALLHGEYRESIDLDFLVSSRAGYRSLRERVTGATGVQALARREATLRQAREVRADQYGLRTMLAVDALEVKLEISVPKALLWKRIKALGPAVAR